MKHNLNRLSDVLNRTADGANVLKRYAALVVENAKLRRQIWHLRKLLAYYQEDFK